MDDTVVAAAIAGTVGILSAFGVHFLKQHGDRAAVQPIQTAEAFGEVFRGFEVLFKRQKDEVDDLRKQVEELTIENRRLRSELQVLRNDYEELQRRIAQQNQRVQGQVGRQDDEVKVLKDEVSNLQTVIRMINHNNTNGDESKDG